ncbi:hypothetical protein BsWGS_03928 [Bradybaena similaris]
MKPNKAFPLSRSTGNMIVCVLGVFAVFILLEVSWTRYEYVKSSVCRIVEKSGLTPSGYFTSQQGWTCVDRLAHKYNRVEDIFCVVLPKFLPHLKNPCIYENTISKNISLRCLPYFYIIGMDKCGSTDLHNRLVQHPFVMGNKGDVGKETYFWSWLRYGIYNRKPYQRNLSLDDYLDMFDNTAEMINQTNITTIITGDATPMDLWDFRSWRKIPQNFGKVEPEVLTPHLLKYIHGERPPKFLIQFREPIERLYSDYIFLRYGKTPEQFHNRSLQAIKMMNACLGNYTTRQCYFSDSLYHQLPVRIHLGCYSVFLQEWFHVFPRNYFLITTMDEYQDDMENTLKKVFTFLDLPSLPESKMAKIINQTRRRVTKRKHGVVLPETAKALRQFYDTCNKNTADLLNDDRFLWLNHYL